MLKPYYCKNSQPGSLVSAVEEAPLVLFLGSEGEEPDDLGPEPIVPTEYWEQNNVQLIEEKLSHLDGMCQQEMLDWLGKYPLVFCSTPGRVAVVEHDIDVGNAVPVKLPPTM